MHAQQTDFSILTSSYLGQKLPEMTPLAWFLLQRWLRRFLYRTQIRVDIFIIAGALTVFIAMITVSYQSIKAATAKPVDSLRYE